MNKRLRLAVRNAACTNCRLHTQAEDDDVCVTGQGPNGARVVVVTKFPLSPQSRTKKEIEEYLSDAGLDADRLMWLSALKCRTWDMDPTKTDQKTCASYLRAEFEFLNPDWVLCLGAEAWFAASGWADITKNRGKLFDVVEGDGQIFPTISPSAVARNPGLRQGFISDLRYFARLVDSDGHVQEVPHHNNDGRRTVVRTKEALRAALKAVGRAGVVAYDIEAQSASGGYCEEHDPDAVVVSIAVTIADGLDMDTAHTYEIPLYHPESPFRKSWVQVLIALIKRMLRVPRRVAHNAKFDTKWLQHHTGIEEFLPTFDTIVAAALLDENRPKGLKPLAQMLLGAEPWGIDTKDLLGTPLDDVLTYNGLDTWHTLRLYFVLRQHLIDQPRLGRFFKHVTMPLVQELCYVERRGVYVDQDQLRTNWNVVKANLEDIHDKLDEWIPADHPFKVYDKRTGELRKTGVNWNPSNFLRWFLFDHLELPVIARGKAKDDGRPGDPSTAESVMMTLAEHHPAAQLLLERVKWNKFDTSFFTPWSTLVDENSRMHSVFKPWGTVTGRLSSGKEDSEKITAGSKKMKGVNLQQVPRGSLTRGVFGAPPGSYFVEFDYSQIELRVAAFLAREDTMLHLYATGQDIHMAMAMRMTGKPKDQVTPEERKKAKAVNFGFLYGMGWRKFVSTAWENYGVRVSEEEAQAFRKAFFDQFPKLMPWHAKQRRMAHKYGRVETPMGRVRHLPDIYSPDQGVQAEAERQAINSPVQAFASDMCAMSLVINAREFRSLGIKAWPIGTVHDAVNWEIHGDDLERALPIIKHNMENLPLERLFGLTIDVPIIADCKVGTRWGGAKEVPAELMDINAAKNVRLAQWVKENVAA